MFSFPEKKEKQKEIFVLNESKWIVSFCLAAYSFYFPLHLVRFQMVEFLFVYFSPFDSFFFRNPFFYCFFVSFLVIMFVYFINFFYFFLFYRFFSCDYFFLYICQFPVLSIPFVFIFSFVHFLLRLFLVFLLIMFVYFT